MASDESLNFESLLAPISEDTPSGEELRSADAEAYWEIKRLRDAARKDESQTEPVVVEGELVVRGSTARVLNHGNA